MERGLPPARARRASDPGARRLACSVALGLAWAFWPEPAEPAPLPKVALSIFRTSEPGVALGAIDRCGELGSISVVAPALEVDFGATGPASLDLEAVKHVLSNLPESRKLLLHLRVQATLPAPPGESGASVLEDRVAQVVGALPLESSSIGGVILEIAPSPGNLTALQFTLARFVLQVKAAKPSLGPAVVVFPPGLVRQEEALARRVAAYADLIGVGHRTEWRGDAEWVREELRKPVALKVALDPAQGAGGLATAYLDVLAETGDTLIDTVWAEEPTAEQTSALCQSIRALSGSMGVAFVGTPLDQAPATLDAEGDPLVASAFVDSGSTRSAFVVRGGGSPARPRRFTVSAKGEGDLAVSCRSALDGRALTTHPVEARGKSKAQECTSDVPYVVVSVQRENPDERLYE